MKTTVRTELLEGGLGRGNLPIKWVRVLDGLKLVKESSMLYKEVL